MVDLRSPQLALAHQASLHLALLASTAYAASRRLLLSPMTYLALAVVAVEACTLVVALGQRRLAGHLRFLAQRLLQLQALAVLAAAMGT